MELWIYWHNNNVCELVVVVVVAADVLCESDSNIYSSKSIQTVVLQEASFVFWSNGVWLSRALLSRDHVFFGVFQKWDIRHRRVRRNCGPSSEWLIRVHCQRSSNKNRKLRWLNAKKTHIGFKVIHRSNIISRYLNFIEFFKNMEQRQIWHNLHFMPLQ